MSILGKIQFYDAAVTGANLVCIAIAASGYYLGVPDNMGQDALLTLGGIGALGIIVWFAFARNFVKKDLASKSD